MAKGDTKTNQYLDIAANGTRADLPSDTCCETRSQTLIREVAERIIDVEEEVEELKNNPDVVDIVATYADLQAYDTQHLTDKDIIRVLQDETHDGESTYYRYNKQSDTWTYIGESKQYDDFVGTDGTAAGSAGLVPAPATTDAGKYLKADGTWDAVQAGPTVVQTTGTSTTDVMSQNAVTSMVYADPSTKRHIFLGSGYSGDSYGISIGDDTYTYGGGSYGGGVAIGRSARVRLGASNAVAIGLGADAEYKGQFDISTSRQSSSAGYNNSQYRLLTGLYDGQSAHDAATKGQLDSIAIQNAGAPTTATVGTVGQLLEDTTNGKLYICTAIVPGTDPDPDTYTWTEVGAGGGGGITELTTADYNWPTSNPSGIALWLLDSGMYQISSPGATIKLYHYSDSAIGASSVYGDGTTFIVVENREGGNTTKNIYINNYWYNDWVNNGALNTANYYDTGDALMTHKSVIDSLTSTAANAPLSAKQGKVLKDLVDSLAIRGAGAPTTSTAGQVGTLYEDTTNGNLYICTDATNPYVWEEVGAGGGTTVLTTADYNWPVANPNGIAYWLLEPGYYTMATDLRFYHDTAASYSTGRRSFLVSGGDNDKTALVMVSNSTAVIEHRNEVATGAAVSGWPVTLLNSADILQTTGISTTDVMSQNAVTSMVFADPANKTEVCIGNNATTSTTHTVNLGDYSSTNYQGCVALGAYSGGYGTFTSRGVVAINSTNLDYGYGGNSNYRLLTGLYDGQSAHDAATYGQLSTAIINGGTTAPTTATVGAVGTLYSAVVSNTAHLYACTAIDDTTDPQNPSYTWTTLV